MRAPAPLLSLLAAAAAVLFAAASAEAAPKFKAQARVDPALLCEQAISQAAARRRAPARLLHALAKVESGRKGRPWPWTVNAGGEGRWFDDKASALKWAEEKLAAGVRSIDLGCMQINRIWHGDAFASLAEMLDPQANADYAARYLMELESETGDWMRAAGYYHSRTKEHFERYSALVASAYDALGAAPRQRPPSRSARPRTASTPSAPAVAPQRPEPPMIAAAPPQKLPDEVRVALWSGLLRRPHKELFQNGFKGVSGDPAVPSGASRRGGVSLAFKGGKGSLLTRGKPLVADRRQGILKK